MSSTLILWGSSHLQKCYKKLIDPITGEEVGIAYYSKKTGELVQNIEVVSLEDEFQKARDQ